VGADRAVGARGHHLAGGRIDDDGAHRRLASRGGGLRRFEGDAHGAKVMVHDPQRSDGAHDPTAHAEIVAIRAAAAKLGNYRLTGLTLVVTLEPCAMCAGAISHARLGRLVFGAPDEKGGAVVNGPRFFEQPTCHWRPIVTAGVLAEESAALLRGFFRARRGKA
jgi:tRNA(Arg) A34 adenosine deaminase TadA